MKYLKLNNNKLDIYFKNSKIYWIYEVHSLNNILKIPKNANI
jgi:hypothetical protein